MTNDILNNSHLLGTLLVLRNVCTPYLVGGCVRDMLLNKKCKDFDIVQERDINDLIPYLINSGFEIKETGTNFKILFVSKDNNQYEIAQFRKDVKTNGRHAIVEVGNMLDDALRRDFTINALYYDPFTDTIFDPTNKGLNDIKTNTLRFVGNPHIRIKEDYLRIFRFYRFLTKGFIADRTSMKACREMFNEAYINTTPERVRMELEKML